MICLAIDTSTRAGTAALQQFEMNPGNNADSDHNYGKTLAELTLDIETVHGRRLLPTIHALLDLAGISLKELNTCALVCGPGSFTGLRVGLATIQGLALPFGLPAVSLSALEVLASGLFIPKEARQTIIRPVMHARRGFVYTAAFRVAGDDCERLEPDQEITVDELAAQVTSPAILLGNAVRLHGELWREALGDTIQLAPPASHSISGRRLGMMAAKGFLDGKAIAITDLRVDYMGPSQAEVNFMARKES